MRRGVKDRTTRTVQVGDRLGTEFQLSSTTYPPSRSSPMEGVSQSVFSFQSPLAKMGFVEITGTEEPHPCLIQNAFTGEVKITQPLESR